MNNKDLTEINNKMLLGTEEAGYCQHTSPKHTPSDAVNNITSVVNNITSPALQYWHDEFVTKGDATREIYLKNFAKFTEFTNKTADELLSQRIENQISKDPKIQRQIESQLIKFISAKREVEKIIQD